MTFIFPANEFGPSLEVSDYIQAAGNYSKFSIFTDTAGYTNYAIKGLSELEIKVDLYTSRAYKLEGRWD